MYNFVKWNFSNSIDNFSKVINEEKGGGRSPEIKDGLNNNSLTVQDSSK